MSGTILPPEERAHLLRMMRHQTFGPVHRRMNTLLLLDNVRSAGRVAEALFIDAELCWSLIEKLLFLPVSNGSTKSHFSVRLNPQAFSAIGYISRLSPATFANFRVQPVWRRASRNSRAALSY